DVDIKLKFLQCLPYVSVVRKGNQRIEADGDQSLDLAPVDGIDLLIGGDPFSGHVFFIDSPDPGYVLSVFRICDVAVPRQLVTFVSVFPSPLAISLPGDGAVTAVRSSDPTCCQHQVDAAAHVLHPFGMVFYSSGMQKEACFSLTPEGGGFEYLFFRNSGVLLSPVQIAVLYGIYGFLKTFGIIVNEIVIQPVVVHQDLKHGTEKS